MKHEATRDLFRYWNMLRGSRASPPRDEIDPAAIRGLLADTFLLETRADGTFRFRLAGTRIEALWLQTQTDRCFLDLWGEDRHSVAAALWTVMDGTVPVVLGAKAAPTGRPEVGAEALLLPLRHHGKTHALILGVLSLAAPPAWIGLMPIERFRLASMRVMTPAEVIDLPVLPTRPTMPRGEAIAQHGHLRVYAGGR